MKQTLGVFLVKLGIAAVFVATAAVTLFFAYGYRFDVNENTVQKTSIIDVVHDPFDAEVFLDDRRISGRMPLQIKGVLPGVHTLRVEREVFVPWQRDLRVEEDVVTIVRDVFLVPQELEEFTEEVLALDAGSEVFFGPNYLLLADEIEDRVTLSLVELFDDGAFREEEVALPEGDILDIETFPGQRFLVKFKDGLMTFVSFRDRQFKTFRPFAGVDKVLVNSGRRLVYLLSDGRLYRYRYDEIGEEPPEREVPFLVEVNDFFVDESGRVFSVSGGELWLDGVPLLEQEEWKSVAVLNGPAGDDLLVLRTVNNERYLFLVADGYSDVSTFRLLTDKLSGQPFFFRNGDMLYADEDGTVLSLTTLGLKRFVFQLNGSFELQGPYGTDGHFLLQRNGLLQVRDVFDAHTVTLFENFSAEKLFRFSESLFFYADGVLTRLAW